MSGGPARQPRRSLILAGGGLKVAFQAGVLQVWLDEAGVSFDHADGASGGAFNLAMYCQGLSGTAIADRWRRFRPLRGLGLNWPALPILPLGESLLGTERLRRRIFTETWGLDWARIRASSVHGSFNAYNFSRHELAVWRPAEMSERHLLACVSLPAWYPPVRIGGDTFIDAVYITDANLEYAVEQAGADELWVIWTVSASGAWRPGWVASYFQVIEAAANGHYRRALARIERSNAAIAAGGRGEFGRPIVVRELRAEVPLHYLVNLSADRVAEAVEQGVAAARAWCREQDIPLRAPAPAPLDLTGLRFTETMRGPLMFGAADGAAGAADGRRSGVEATARLTVRLRGVGAFVTDPAHTALVAGTVSCPALGLRLTVEDGAAELLIEGPREPRGRGDLLRHQPTDPGDPALKLMRYRLLCRDQRGAPLTLSGVKVVADDPGADLWPDTTTLDVRLFRGHVAAAEEAGARAVAAGRLRIAGPDFLRQLASVRVQGPSPGGRARALLRFGLWFLRNLWDVYARRVQAPGPF